MNTHPAASEEPRPPGLEEIRAAAETLRGQVLRTPLVAAPRLSEALGCDLRLKLENLQVTGAFKARGAFVKLSRLSEAERDHGVIAMSAGNHAQGVAYHARRLGIPATIVMPGFAPFAKVERTRALGAQVVLAGESFADAVATATELAETECLTFVHPFDDPAIVAGQGTIGLEIVEDAPELEALIVPIGGGGLVSGIAIATKALAPRIRLIGVQAEAYATLEAGSTEQREPLGGDTIADGIAVKRPGRLTTSVIARLVDEIRTVSESQIERAIHLLIEQEKTVVEGAGAVGLAAVLADPEAFHGRRVGTVLSGGNIDLRLLSAVLTRGLVRDGRMIKVRIETHDRQGELGHVAQLIGEAAGNIVEVAHQRMFYDLPVKLTELDILIETRDGSHALEVVDALRRAGYRTRILSPLSSEGPA